MQPSVIEQLHAARAAEKEQAQFYRALAAQAEERGAGAEAEALNGLLADEQHHLSRLSARLVELGERLSALPERLSIVPSYDHWRSVAAAREAVEIAQYEALLRESLDPLTREMLRTFLDAEREHARNLGGKYMGA